MSRSILVVVALAAAACSGTHDAAPTPPADVPPPDLTPPAVASRYPGIGDANALASGPYRVVFTEPLDPATVDASAVRVWQATGRVPADVSLSADGTTLTITPSITPDIPGWVWVELTTALKDRAGNSLVPDAEPWAFELPVWVKPGGDGPISPDIGSYPTSSSVALDANDEPVVWGGGIGSRPLRFTEGAWIPLSGAPVYGIEGSVAGDGEGGIWAGAVGSSSGAVARFTDPGWSLVGTGVTLSNAAAQPSHPRLAVRAGDPILLWIEESYPAGNSQPPVDTLQVRGWNGGAWTVWADSSTPVVSNPPALAVGPTGAIVAAWTEPDMDVRVARVGPLGLELIDVSAGSVYSASPTVSSDLDGNPVVALWDGPSLRAKTWTGTEWRQIGADLTVSYHGGSPVMAIGADGLPVVAWTDGVYPSPRQLFVAKFDGSQWQQLGGPLNADPTHDVYAVALALDRHGAPVLAWPEATTAPSMDPGAPASVYQMQVKRLNR